MANYLYNGVELPDINEVWTDKETYPYAFVLRAEAEDGDVKVGDILLYISDTKGEFNELGQIHMISQPHTTHVYHLQDNQYNYFDGGYMDIAYPLHYEGYLTLLWASHDICRVMWDDSKYEHIETDEVVFAASDPVPVSIPSPSPDQTSMYLGWLVGRQITGLRKIKVIRDAELIDGVLYIKNANAILNGDTLEVK